jgi:hypothetical protein
MLTIINVSIFSDSLSLDDGLVALPPNLCFMVITIITKMFLRYERTFVMIRIILILLCLHHRDGADLCRIEATMFIKGATVALNYE